MGTMEGSVGLIRGSGQASAGPLEDGERADFKRFALNFSKALSTWDNVERADETNTHRLRIGASRRQRQAEAGEKACTERLAGVGGGRSWARAETFSPALESTYSRTEQDREQEDGQEDHPIV